MSNPKVQPSIKAMLNKPHTNGVEHSPEEAAKAAPAKGKKKQLEDIYVKKTQLEHILLRPDTYIGSVEFNTENMWVYNKESERIIQKEITYVPGLYKIFDEILVNAADHKQRDPKMDCIKIDINQEENLISVWNNGKGIPVSVHKGEKMFIPTMIFGHLLTSSNYDDQEQKVTGGRNGFGAKLCNIFSTKFVVETSCQEFKKSFKQAWANNMSKASDPKIKDFSGTQSTKISFSPDLSKFKMERLDDDIVSLMSRRAYDVAASTRGVKVFLNGKKLPVKSFKEYVELYLKDKEDDSGNPLKCVYESSNSNWEVAVALSDTGSFQQMSFVNSIATTKGGRHVDNVTDMIVKNLLEVLKKKNKSGVNIKPSQIKHHMWLFVNALIVNPTFDSQTKETMTLQVKNFGSKCTFTDKFTNAVVKSGIVEAVMNSASAKQQKALQSKCTGKKLKLKGIPKLEDANDAASKHSAQCTLILTEGDSAKTLAVAGLGVIGRDRYGVFPLKGKLLNVREATTAQIKDNAEIQNVINIMGLQRNKKYESPDELKTLRYGKLMIMTDQDHDGSHIKGLLINFIHHHWPALLRQTFLEEFITPIVKASKGKEVFSFYSIPEFDEWKKSKSNWHTYKIKYYKGLGTSTSKEAKEYFQDMLKHRIIFNHQGSQDDHSIVMAFSKKMVDQRKEWLTSWMEECKRRKELGLPDIYLYEKDTRSINYSDFINKELVLFSNLDNERSIPSVVDGLKPGQRKVMFTCMKRCDKKEVKVAQLAGSVAEHSAYHHGEASLMSTIINLAQNYVGSNNINLLKPIGQFGTRLLGGKDAASPRYIFTQLSPLTKNLFNSNDEPLLNFLKDDNKRIEPEWYIPIIPMVLVNGAEGIGTGWSTKIPNYNPREIVENLKRMIKGEDPLPMKPWYKNFLGTIDQLDEQRIVIHGEIAKITHNKFEITELPIRTWTQTYKENVMEPLLHGNEKNPALIGEYREYHTDTSVRFVVSVPEEKVDRVDSEGPHKVFKLQSMSSLSSMVLFDHNGCIKRYRSAEEILQEFFQLRLKYYEKRKVFMVGALKAETAKLSNQARFILEKCDGRLSIENKKKKDMIAELQRKGFDSDPVKAWKVANSKDSGEDSDDDDDEEVSTDGPDYDYLLGMTMWMLTLEKKNELLKKKDEKVHELETLMKLSPSDLWINDLETFMIELDAVEAIEKEEDRSGKKEMSQKGAGSKKRKMTVEALPSPSAERIAPKIDTELKRKAERAQAAGAKGKTKKLNFPAPPEDEFDAIVSSCTDKGLAARLGDSPNLIEKRMNEDKKKLKQTTINFKPKPKPKGKQKLTMDSDDELEDSDRDMDVMEVDVEPRERAGGRRVAAQKAKYNFSDNESSDGDLSLHSNEGIDEIKPAVQNLTFDDDSVVEPAPKRNGKAAKEIDISDTDSEFEQDEKPKSRKPLEQSASDMFDSLLNADSTSPPKETKEAANVIDSDDGELPLSERLGISAPVADSPPKAKKKTQKAAPKRKSADSDSGDDIFDKKPKPKKTAAKAAKKQKFEFSDDDDSDFGSDKVKPKPASKATKKKNIFSDEEEDSFDFGSDKVKPKPASKATKKKNVFSDEEEDCFDFGSDKVKPKPASKATKKKNIFSDEEEDSFDVGSADVQPRATSGRSRPAAKYTVSSDSDSDF